MRNLARRGASSVIVQAVAQNFVSGDPMVIIRSLDDWMRAHFVYRGEFEEVIRTPEFMLDTVNTKGYMDGDCDDISTLYASILAALKIPSRFVAIRYDPSPEFRHVYVEVWTGVRWIPVDPTVERGTPYNEIERMVVDV